MSSPSFNNCTTSDPSQTQYCDLLNTYIEYHKNIQQQQTLSAPMYWIGIYITAASLVCTILMAADVILGFHQRKLWFPCKYFTLNAASLTLLGVAMKLPVDLTSSMPEKIDQIAKLSSTAFMCTAMGHFMPSLGPMDSRELLLNVTALGIMVITMFVNIDIQIRTGAIFVFIIPQNLVRFCMLVLFIVIGFSALKVPIFKKILQVKYDEKHKVRSNERTEKFKVEELKEDVKKYWMMAESGGPQFVMASCVTCSASGAICFLTALGLGGAAVTMFVSDGWKSSDGSDYKQSTFAIFLIQSAGVVVGTIAQASRWFRATSLKKGSYNVFRIEKYWTQRLMEWKQSPIGLQIRGRKRRKLVQDTKNIILYICIVVQVVIVVASKIVRLIPIIFRCMVCSCFCCKQNKRKNNGSETDIGKELDLGRYFLQLEGEQEIPQRVLRTISNSVNHCIQKAKKKQPKNLMKFLEKSSGFKGVTEFDNDQVPCLHYELPNSWSLAVATLTSIAILLPKIKKKNVNRLLCSVSEGFSYVRLIEKSLDTKGSLAAIRDASDVVWLTLELYRKWVDKDLKKKAIKDKTTEEYLQRLSDVGKNRVVKFQRNMNGSTKENHHNWPVKIIAANSMYRISQTILIGYQGSNDKEYKKLFEKLSVMIADILGACLTNLPRVITTKCYCSAIEKREESLQEAARLLGETEEILKILQERGLPSLGTDQAAYIDEWRDILKLRNPQASVPSVNNESAFGFGELHISIE